LAIFVVGANHRSCSGLVRDRLVTEEIEVPALLARLTAAGISQALWLATCDRVEVQGVHEQPASAALAIAALLAERAGMDQCALTSQLYTLTGEAAVRHIFAVACSLDSQIVGEPEVLGQVKAAHRLAAAAGTTASELEAVLQAAFAAAKRVRSETAIAERPTSIAAAALQIARDLHGDLARRSALLLGVGDMGLMMLNQLRGAGLARAVVMAPGDARARRTAERLGRNPTQGPTQGLAPVQFAPLAELEGALAQADVIITAVGHGNYLLAPGMVEKALKKRRQQPLYLIDTAVPADVDPAVNDLDAAFVYDLGDLERVALAGRVSREAAATAAWAIVDQAVATFQRQRAERSAVPLVVALRRHFEHTRRDLLVHHPGLDAAEATRLLVNRLLHRPSEVLRQMAADPDDAGLAERAAAERLLRHLFGVDSHGDDPGAPDAMTADPAAQDATQG